MESKNPALLGEWLPITISLLAEENVTTISLHIILALDGSNDQSSMFHLNIPSFYELSYAEPNIIFFLSNEICP